jgi:hypothetical protein
MFSYHQDASPSSSFHPAYGFVKEENINLFHVAKIISNFNWCPGVFEDGHRCMASWKCAVLVGLDFDDGMSLMDAKKIFQNHACIIGTTLNHQKEKNGVVCDRFRVILLLEEKTENIADYRNTVQKLAATYESDPAAADAARYFRPCHKIEVIRPEGQKVKIMRVPPWHAIRQESIRRAKIEDFQKRGVIPKFCRDFIEEGIVYKKGRNSTAYAVIMMLIDCGLCRGDIERMILNAPINRHGLKPKELETVLKSVFSRKGAV